MIRIDRTAKLLVYLPSADIDHKRNVEIFVIVVDNHQKQQQKESSINEKQEKWFYWNSHKWVFKWTRKRWKRYDIMMWITVDDWRKVNAKSGEKREEGNILNCSCLFSVLQKIVSSTWLVPQRKWLKSQWTDDGWCMQFWYRAFGFRWKRKYEGEFVDAMMTLRWWWIGC